MESSKFFGSFDVEMSSFLPYFSYKMWTWGFSIKNYGIEIPLKIEAVFNNNYEYQ